MSASPLLQPRVKVWLSLAEALPEAGPSSARRIPSHARRSSSRMSVVITYTETGVHDVADGPSLEIERDRACRPAHGAAGGRPGTGRHEERRMAHLRRRSRQHAVRAARSNQREQLQEPSDRVAIQDGDSRTPAGLQSRSDTVDDQWRVVYDCRLATRRRGDRRGHRRAAVDVPPRRNQARRRIAQAAVRPRRGLLDRRRGRRSRVLRDDRLSARRPRREDRGPRARIRPERHRRSQAGGRSGARSDHGRDRAELSAGRREKRGDRRRRSSGRRGPQE